MPDQVVRDPEIPLAVARAPSTSGRRAARAAAGVPAMPVAAPVPTPTAIDLVALRRDLLSTVTIQHPQASLAMIDRAFDLAVEAHRSQVRASGEPYVAHPIASAIALQILSPPAGASPPARPRAKR